MNKRKGFQVLRIAPALIAGVGVVGGQAQASQSFPRFENLSPKQIKRVSDVLICARTLVQKFGETNPEAISLAGSYLEQVAPAAESLEALKEIDASCRESIRDMRAQSRRASAEDSETAVTDLLSAFSSHVRRTLRTYQSPRGSCTVAGPEVSAALGVGLTAGVLGGVCKNSDGRQAFVLGAEAGILAGVAATVGVSVYEFDMRPGQLAAGIDSSGLGISIGVGARLEQSSSGSAGAVEVGAGYYWYKSASGVLKVLPLGSNRRSMVQSFLGGQDDGESPALTPIL